MKKVIASALCLIMCLAFCACGFGHAAERDALVGTKWFSAVETSNSIVVWNFYEESVERAEYFVDGNGMHDSEKKVADYTVQKDVIKVEFDDEEVLIPYTFRNSEMNLKEGEYFSVEDIEEGLQGYWNLRNTSVFFGNASTNEYNVLFDDGTIVIEEAAEALNGYNGQYYYYGPYEGEYTIGDGFFETEASHGERYFFNVYDGEVNVFYYGNQMRRGNGFPGPDGYDFD